MARRRIGEAHIHIVVYAPGGVGLAILAAFTSKPELDLWIYNEVQSDPDFMEGIEIHTLRDGVPGHD